MPLSVVLLHQACFSIRIIEMKRVVCLRRSLHRSDEHILNGRPILPWIKLGYNESFPFPYQDSSFPGNIIGQLVYEYHRSSKYSCEEYCEVLYDLPYSETEQ